MAPFALQADGALPPDLRQHAADRRGRARDVRLRRQGRGEAATSPPGLCHRELAQAQQLLLRPGRAAWGLRPARAGA